MAASLLSGRLVVGQEQPVSVALDARERLFEQLATDAAQFDARNILKKVVRVSKPSVVHIQSRKIVQSGSRRTIEEAGSGFVIEINQQKYILTNRHVVFPTVADGVKISLEDSSQSRACPSQGASNGNPGTSPEERHCLGTLFVPPSFDCTTLD